MRYYAGVGSRETPLEILHAMVKIGYSMAKKGLCLRSGAAPGADMAFEKGCDIAQGPKEIFIPWRGFQNHPSLLLPTPMHYELAATIHPAWTYLKRGAQALHARNSGQILGLDLQTPVELVIYYAVRDHKGEVKGGTRTAVVLAEQRGIPCYNLYDPGMLDQVANLLLKISEDDMGYDLMSNDLPDDVVFVFGSNTAGIHGAGAAQTALQQYGAIWGYGEGLQGRSYAIPTKDHHLRRLPLEVIQQSVDRFKAFAASSDRRFYLTPVGTGLSRYTHHQIAPMFAGVQHTYVPRKWVPYVQSHK